MNELIRLLIKTLSRCSVLNLISFVDIRIVHLFRVILCCNMSRLFSYLECVFYGDALSVSVMQSTLIYAVSA